MRVLDPHDSALDAPDLVAPVAELKNVAGKAFDGEILVDCPDEMVFRLQQHLIVGVVGDGSPRGQSGQARAATPAQDPIDGVMVDQRTASASPRAEAVREHVDDRAKIFARQVPVWPRSSNQREQSVFAPLARRHFRHDLLRQHVERPVGYRQTIELAAADAVEQRRALHKFVAG